MSNDEATVWVKSGLAPDGKTHISTLELDDDTSILLDAETTNLLGTHVEMMCARAEFIGKIYKQLQHLKIPQEDLLEAIKKVRDNLVPDHSVDHLPVRVVAALTQEGKPFLILKVRDEDAGQLDLRPALNWASHIRSARHWSELDQTYFDMLVNDVGVEPATARGTINALSEINLAEPPKGPKQFIPARPFG